MATVLGKIRRGFWHLFLSANSESKRQAGFTFRRAHTFSHKPPGFLGTESYDNVTTIRNNDSVAETWWRTYLRYIALNPPVIWPMSIKATVLTKSFSQVVKMLNYLRIFTNNIGIEYFDIAIHIINWCTPFNQKEMSTM